jgi:type IV pilus assembly protein PilC
MTADNINAVEQRLRQQQLTPSSIKKKSREISLTLGSGVNSKELVTFTRQFATMIDAGLPLVQCLDILAGQQQNKIFKNVLKDIKSSVEQGATFSDSLKRHPKVFDELYTNLVHAGEVGGILDTILTRLAVYIEKNVKLMRQIRGAMTYPIIVIFIMIGVMIVLLTFVIPAFENMFKDFGAKDALPKLTQAVIWVSQHFVSSLPVTIPATIVAVVAVSTIYKRPKGKRFFHRVMLTIPIFGDVIRKIAVARFTRTMGTLLQSGVPILDALEVVAKSSGNVIIEEGLMYTRAKISEGKNLADPLMESKVFPTMVVQMISVGEQTGALDQMLNKVADFYEEETDVAVSALTSMIEPLLMVVVGGMVGVVLMAMYLPIFSLAGAMKSE